MTKMTTVEARDHFSDLINRAAYGKERIILTRRGKALAAVVPVEDIDGGPDRYRGSEKGLG